MISSRFFSVVGITLVAIVAGVWLYPGSLGAYLLFTAVFFTILYFGIFCGFQYSHFFLSIAWFIGFWLKSAVHFASSAPYCEPVGSFDASAHVWDNVVLAASIGGLGYLTGRLLILPAVKGIKLPTVNCGPPWWYGGLRTPLWLSIAVALIAILIANHEMGLIVRGYVAKVQLPWPLGGLFSWITDIGLALTISVLTAWDRASGFGVVRGFFALCIEGAVLSVATLSRGLYFFHTLPAFASEGRALTSVRLQFRRITLLLTIWFSVALAIPLLTTGLRLIGDKAMPTTQAKMDAETGKSPAETRSASIDLRCSISEPYSARSILMRSAYIARALIIDRWTGLEGLMSSETYANRSMSLLKEAALFRRSYGAVDVYTDKISASGFTEENARIYHFATLAGPMAFFDFSGSWMVVFAGMALLAMLMSLLEILWSNLFHDPLVIAMSGCYLALVVLQLSGGVIQAATGPATVTVFLALIWLINRTGIAKAQILSSAQHPLK
ncbi:MAG: hypothetical protein E6Q77_05055 [Rhizobium sp.]|nr:MAG: hypothetical protein E6Q77_05055 [Rhizobium sp.]